MSHPTRRLDPAVHQPARLGILTAAHQATRIDFVTLRELLELTDGNLSRHLRSLEAAGYVAIEKTFERRRPRTSITLTAAGRAALETELEALREIVAAADATTGTRRPAPSGRPTAGPAP